MKKIKLDQGRLLGFKILPQTPKVGKKPMGTSTTLKSKVGLKPGTMASTILSGKIGVKVGGKDT